MKAAILVKGIPSPAVSGSMLMGWSVARSLLNAGHRVTALCLLAPAQSEDGREENAARAARLRELGVDVAQIEQPEEPFSRLRLLRRSLWPGAAVYYDALASRSQVREALARLKPEALFVYHFDALAATWGLSGTPRMAIVGDPSHLPIIHRWRFGPKNPTPRNLWRTWIALLSGLRTPPMQVSMLKECAASGSFAAQEAQWFQQKGVRQLRYFHPPVDDGAGPGWHKLRRATPGGEKPKILIVGHLHGIATLTGLRLFARRVLPILEERLGPSGFEVHIVGRYEPPADLARLLDRPGVRLRGYVPDISAEFLSADVLLVPIPIRLGWRARIVTGFSYGCCVVAHRNNALGIPKLMHEENCLLGESAEELAEVVVRAVKDPALRQRLGVAGRETYERHFTLEAAGRPIVQALEVVAAGGGA